MKVQVASDLHLDHKENRNVFKIAKDADLLVIAGDIGHARETHVDFIKWCARQVETIFVKGNHDPIFSSVEDTDAFWNGQKIENFHYLNNKTIPIKGIHFIGTTLWSDLYADPVNNLTVLRGMIDYQYIKKQGKDELVDIAYMQRLYEESLYFIKQEMSKDYARKVLITHHLPSYSSIAPRYINSQLNSAFASNLDNLLLYADNLELCIHGHTHDYLDYLLADKLRIVCNPMGYPGEHKNFVEDKIIIL